MLGADILFSKDGWLLMSKERGHLFFFNPFTKVKYELPPTPSSPSDIKLVCFTSPPTSSECFIFGIFWTRKVSKFGLIKFGDHEWESGCLDDFQPSTCPPLFHNGKFCSLEHDSRNIGIFDPNREDESRWMRLGVCRETTIEEEEDEGHEHEEQVILNSCICREESGIRGGRGRILNSYNFRGGRGIRGRRRIINSYMLEVEGDILGVFVRNHSEQVRAEKLDLSAMRWSKHESLGDKLLYLSRSGSFDETLTKFISTSFTVARAVLYAL